MRSDLTRRHLVAGTSATIATALAPLAIYSPAFATAPQAAKQAPGFYRYKVGAFEITVVTDGAATFPLPDKFVQNHPKSEVQAALAAYYQPTDTVTVPFTPIVINTGSKLVLVDTGYGPEMNVKMKGRVGQLPENLAAAGIDPKSIDTVIISHMHLDHVSGLRTADGGIAFPNAEILVPASDWAFWMSDAEMNKLPEGYTKSRAFARRSPGWRTKSRNTKGARRSSPASQRSRRLATRRAISPSSLLRDRPRFLSSRTSPISRTCSCAIPIGR
jgi:hypothetical protein